MATLSVSGTGVLGFYDFLDEAENSKEKLGKYLRCYILKLSPEFKD